MADASVGFLEDGEGEGDSAKSEMTVALSVKLRLQGGGVCDMTARYCHATTGVTLRLHTAFEFGGCHLGPHAAWPTCR